MKDEDGQFSRTDAGIKYTLTQENGQNRLLYNASCNKSLSEVGLTAYYGNYSLDSDGKYRIQDEQNPPPGINNNIFLKISSHIRKMQVLFIMQKIIKLEKSVLFE
ncbi:MAG: hypothetical protein L6V95_00335 [Candidatus Melainabacteria bacterium]|nr:MAG: hypothetical protein L6V95_00335 [Candidatus Melainabacteria bacterium]